jgi:hypothetical protein
MSVWVDGVDKTTQVSPGVGTDQSWAQLRTVFFPDDTKELIVCGYTTTGSPPPVACPTTTLGAEDGSFMISCSGGGPMSYWVGVDAASAWTVAYADQTGEAGNTVRYPGATVTRWNTACDGFSETTGGQPKTLNRARTDDGAWGDAFNNGVGLGVSGLTVSALPVLTGPTAASSTCYRHVAGESRTANSPQSYADAG